MSNHRMNFLQSGSLNKDHIILSVFNRRVASEVARAVVKAAQASGVSHRIARASL